MTSFGQKRLRRVAALAAGLLAIGPWTALAQPEGLDPQAAEILKAATAYLAGQKRFHVETRSTLEVILTSGQKIQFDHAAALAVQRPDKLRAERRGDLVDQVFTYDGKFLQLHNPGDGYFARVAAPDTLEGMLDFARESLDIVAPAGDLIYANAFEILMADATSGFVVGPGVVAGVRCRHLAFRSPHADWQIWIQEGDQPLPRKLVITSRDVAGMPQFAVVMTAWDLAPQFGDRTFDTTPPRNARQVDFVGASPMP